MLQFVFKISAERMMYEYLLLRVSDWYIPVVLRRSYQIWLTLTYHLIYDNVLCVYVGVMN
jgi:hypothetical protein